MLERESLLLSRSVSSSIGLIQTEVSNNLIVIRRMLDDDLFYEWLLTQESKTELQLSLPEDSVDVANKVLYSLVKMELKETKRIDFDVEVFPVIFDVDRSSNSEILLGVNHIINMDTTSIKANISIDKSAVIVRESEYFWLNTLDRKLLKQYTSEHYNGLYTFHDGYVKGDVVEYGILRSVQECLQNF